MTRCALVVNTADGWLEFQDYFVRRRCTPAVLEMAYDGAAAARPHPEIIAALADPRLRAVVICPSNPYLSIEPILAVAGMRAAIAACPAPVVAVSPIIGGRVRERADGEDDGELGLPVSAAAVARRYADLIDGYVLDEADAAEAAGLGIPATPAPTLMSDFAGPRAIGAPGACQRRCVARGDGMSAARNICAVVPVKDTAEAKQRLAGVLSPAQRRELALAMLDHVLAVLSSVPELAGILVVTVDPEAAALAASYRHGSRSPTHAKVTAAQSQRPRATWRHAAPICSRCPATFRWSRLRISATPGRALRGSSAQLTRLLHRGSARSARLQRGALLAGRRGAAALRRR